MILSKTELRKIVNQIIDLGEESDGDCQLTIYRDGTWAIIYVTGPNDSVNFADNSLEFFVPTYEDEAFIEDKKLALMSDLTFALARWERFLVEEPQKTAQRKAAKKTNALLKKKNPNHWREAAKKRWKKEAI